MPERRTQPARTFLALQNATFRLGDRLVFENTNWSMGVREQWAIIGPNGSGKSILGDGLRGRLPLVGGEICYRFRPPAGLSPEGAIGHVAFEDRKSEMHGTVVQSRWNSLEDTSSLRVQEFLSYERVMEVNPFEVSPIHERAKPQFERRLRRAGRLLRVGDLWSRRLLSLSNGERQRVQLARALAQPLRLLILDEPYVGLDAATRKAFHHTLEHLARTPLRVLLVTVRVEDLPRHITHILQVDNCRVRSAGPRGGLSTSHRVPQGFRPSKLAPKPKLPSNSEATAGASLIELRKVTVRYGENVILRNINWTVRAGESWALLGPNGSGKTTLLSLVQGDNPQAYVNHVVIFGRQRGTGESVWELKKRIGWISPELQLHFDDSISVLDAVISGFQETVGLFEPPSSANIAKARRWLTRFGLCDVEHSPLFSLSAGLQRMALLARALVKQPRLLILDEPCQGLDSTHRDLIIASVDSLIRSGAVTAIFVTHRPEEIPSSVTRVLRLSKKKARP